MRRTLVFVGMVLLAGCATPDPLPGTATTATADPTPEPACVDAGTAWTEYLRRVSTPGTGDPAPYRNCAASLGHDEAVEALGSALSGPQPRGPEFERGMAYLRAAAIDGSQRAQRRVADLYVGTDGWYGRNAYLALFWEGVARRNDPTYRAAPESRTVLDRYRALLSDESRWTLDRQIAAWRPGGTEPPSLAVDIWLTHVLRATETLSYRTSLNIIKRARRMGLHDAGVLHLLAHGKNMSREAYRKLVIGEAKRGSLLAVGILLSIVADEPSDDVSAERVALWLFERLGLDPASMTARQFALVETFASTRDLNGLIAAVRTLSFTDRQLVGTLATMTACDPAAEGGTKSGCLAAMTAFDPYLPPPARRFLTLRKSQIGCDGANELLACYLDTGGFAALRDAIANDLIDEGGRGV